MNRKEYDKLKQRKIKKNDLDHSQELRIKELKKLLHTQYILDNEGKLHSSFVKTNTFKFDTPKAVELKKILNTEVVSIPQWMCDPKYRDAIIFYNKEGKVISSLNVCLSCQHLQTTNDNHINADESTYNLLKDFFIKIGHDVE